MNWHTPSITPAEGLTAFAVVLALNLVLFLAKPRYPAARVKPDTEDEIVGDLPHLPRGGL